MNPLAIRIAADLKVFKANMAEMKVLLETNQAAMKRMTSAFDGNKIIGDANAMAIAIDKIGGVSKLTDTEMRRVNATVTEALAKYKALGREAPPELLALRDATKQVATATAQVAPPVDSLTSKLKGMAGMLGLAFGGAAVIGGIKSLVSNTFAYAETIKDTSAKMGVSMEATQRWKFAAEQTGASLENVSKSVLKLSQGIDGDDKSLRAALTQAGIQFDSLKGMKPEDAFNVVAGAIAKIPDPMTQSRLALEAFGKSGTELLPAMREGFLKLADGAKVMSDETIKRLDDAKDAWSALGQKITIVSGEILANAGEGLKKFLVFLDIAMTQGVIAAEQWRLAINKSENASVALTDAQNAMDAAFAKTYASQNKLPPVIDKTTASVKKQGESWSGTNEELYNSQNIAKLVQMELDAMSKISWSNTNEGLDRFNQLLWDSGQVVQGITWNLTIADIKNFEQALLDADAAAEKLAFSLKGSLLKSLEGLGSVIVGAIQGGGNVARAAFASIGASLGEDLGKKIAESIGGSLGKALGSFAGPLGALLGSAVGGLLDKIFGKNEGRDMAKQFASMNGGFDSLRQKMIALGAEGERLWIALTQNTRGPEQVAATIREIEKALAGLNAQQDQLERFDGFMGPEGARGFPTRAQLAQAAADAKATWEYTRDSGEYNAREVTQAWEAWQAAAIAAGDEVVTALKDIDAEMKTLKESIGAEAWEEEMGSIEKAERARLEALEAERAAVMENIEAQQSAEEAAAAAAAASAKKEFDKAKDMAEDLDDEFYRIFSKGYDVPIRFQMPGNSGGSGNGGGTGGGNYNGSMPALPSRSSANTTIQVTVVSKLDGEVIGRNTVKTIAKLLPAELDFIGA